MDSLFNPELYTCVKLVRLSRGGENGFLVGYVPTRGYLPQLREMSRNSTAQGRGSLSQGIEARFYKGFYNGINAVEESYKKGSLTSILYKLERRGWEYPVSVKAAQGKSFLEALAIGLNLSKK